jgi:Phosphotransferase enzyme family
VTPHDAGGSTPLYETDRLRGPPPACCRGRTPALGHRDPAASGYGIWIPDGTAPAATWPQALLAVCQEIARVSGWRAALAASPAGAAPFRAGYARLRELVTGLPQDRHVIHGDLANRNVLINGATITAVIDPGNAMYGDHLYDAAWLIYWCPWFPAWQDIDIGRELRQHWDRHGGTPADLYHRLLTYLIHIGPGRHELRRVQTSAGRPGPQRTERPVSAKSPGDPARCRTPAVQHSARTYGRVLCAAIPSRSPSCLR